jgi:NitT/TauT family transport system ATP-binding protein
LIGPSGCGKTTLLEIVAGLDQPTSGRVLIGGRRVEGPSASVAVVFQEYPLFPWRTVSRNLEYFLQARGVPAAERFDRCRRQLETFGLWELRDAYPFRLSGGMKQRVALAQALVSDPDVLLLDEPFSALDAYNRHLARASFLRLRERWARTILLVTHDLDEALLIADRIVVMTEGPGRIKEILELSRAVHKRDLYSPALLDVRRHVEALLFPAAA